jgi:hypothetical protein
MTNLTHDNETTRSRPAAESERAERMYSLLVQTDRLTVALEVARITVDMSLATHGTLPGNATPEQIERRQSAINQLLRDSFDALETHGHATLAAVVALAAIKRASSASDAVSGS